MEKALIARVRISQPFIFPQSSINVRYGWVASKLLQPRF